MKQELIAGIILCMIGDILGIGKRKNFKMKYNNMITLKSGRACTLRNGTALDGQELVLMRLDLDNELS